MTDSAFRYNLRNGNSYRAQQRKSVSRSCSMVVVKSPERKRSKLILTRAFYFHWENAKILRRVLIHFRAINDE